MLAKSKLNSVETLLSQDSLSLKEVMTNLSRLWRKKVNTRKWKKMWEMPMKNMKIWDRIVWVQGLKKK